MCKVNHEQKRVNWTNKQMPIKIQCSFFRALSFAFPSCSVVIFGHTVIWNSARASCILDAFKWSDCESERARAKERKKTQNQSNYIIENVCKQNSRAQHFFIVFHRIIMCSVHSTKTDTTVVATIWLYIFKSALTFCSWHRAILCQRALNWSFFCVVCLFLMQFRIFSHFNSMLRMHEI